VKRTLSKRERLLVLQAASYRCAYCNTKLDFSSFCIDHIIPYAAGGSTSIRNSAAACFPCNILKGKRYEKPIYQSS
jgi:5-methylcytosine-specific restriction endonuclease McrA